VDPVTLIDLLTKARCYRIPIRVRAATTAGPLLLRDVVVESLTRDVVVFRPRRGGRSSSINIGKIVEVLRTNGRPFGSKRARPADDRRSIERASDAHLDRGGIE